jgi:hypothetical protein
MMHGKRHTKRIQKLQNVLCTSKRLAALRSSQDSRPKRVGANATKIKWCYKLVIRNIIAKKMSNIKFLPDVFGIPMSPELYLLLSAFVQYQ